MDLDHLHAAIVDWEARGALRPGEAVVVGRHETPPVAGAVRVGGRGPDGRTLVEELGSDGGWLVARRYEDPAAAAAHVFDRLADVVAERHWGTDAWTVMRADVRRGALLRTAALLVAPDLELGADRWAVADRLHALGVEPAGRWWIDGVDGLPAPAEEVVELVRRDGWWVIGTTERGLFTEWARFGREADACRRLFAEVWCSGVVSMGRGDVPPHVVTAHRDAVRAAVAEVSALLDDGPVDGRDPV